MTSTKPNVSVAWKGTERVVARAFGGRRRGPSLGQKCSDVVGVPFSIEVTRNQRGTIRADKVRQAWENAEAEGHPPILVVAKPRQKVEDMKMVVRGGFLLDVLRRAGMIQ